MRPVPTLGQLRKSTAWMWVWCGSANCDHHDVPMALTPFIIRWRASRFFFLLQCEL
jgi:hypothetical protein